MNTLFIQFYSKTSSAPWCYELGNGFSDTYDLCKSKGDFYWIKHSHTDEFINTDLPINKGTIYISCLFLKHLYRAYMWSEKYPDINFIVGGPAASDYVLEGMLPNNITITTKSVENWFGVPNFSGRWNLQIPSEIPENNTIYFTYLIDNICYWGRCNYCSYIESKLKTSVRIRPSSDFEFKDIKYNGNIMIRLGTEAITSQHIKTMLPNLPKIDGLDGYRVFFRAGSKELEVMRTFENLDSMEDVRFNIGIEYPTDRMWNYMKKGYKLNEVLELLNIIKKNLYLTMMLGWNNLIKKDIIDLEEFMKMIPERGKSSSITVRKLFAMPGTYIHEVYERGKEERIGPFYAGFDPKLNNEQIELNTKAKEIIFKYAKEKGYYIQSRRI